MRRMLLGLVFLCASIMPLGGMTAGAQDQEPECEPLDAVGVWAGVCAPEEAQGSRLEQPIPEIAGQQAFRVGFGLVGASTNPFIPSEYMAVVVRRGDFILDLGAVDVLADDTGTPVPDVTRGAVMIVSPEPVDAFTRTLDGGGVLDYVGNGIYEPEGASCATGCLVDPDVPVLLDAGDIAFASQNSLCLWCLMNATAAEIEGRQSPDTGLLEAYVMLEQGGEFSWSTDWERAAARATEMSGTPTADTSQTSPTRFAWAFNPGTKCRGG